MPRLRLSLITGLLLATQVSAVHAADGVEWRVIPYLWGAGIDGELAHARLPITLRPSASFRDVVDDLDAAGMLALEAQGEDFGLFADGMLVDTSRAVRVPIGPVSVPVAINADSRTGLLALQYRLLRRERSHLDIVVGARYWSVETRFSLLCWNAP